MPWLKRRRFHFHRQLSYSRSGRKDYPRSVGARLQIRAICRDRHLDALPAGKSAIPGAEHQPRLCRRALPGNLPTAAIGHDDRFGAISGLITSA